jgi:signal transduction histidine kinase
VTRLRRLVATVRFRITAFATLAALLVLIAAGVALVVTQRRLLTENLDEGIAQRAGQIATLVEEGTVPETLTGLDDDDTVAQVVTEDRREVVAASPNVTGRPPVADPPPASRSQTIRTVHEIPVDEAPFRLVSRRVEGARTGGSTMVYVAGSLDDIEESIAVLATSLLVAVPAVAILLALLVWWLVGRTLRPVEAIRAEVAEIGGGELHRRVPVPSGDDEIARLAHTMNDMLGRVDHAARRQQSFVADASHELRSPLTRIRSALEVDLAHPAGADPADTHRSVLEETVGLQRLVGDLLHLARTDAGSGGSPRRNGPVDLDDLVVRQARRLRADGRVAVDISGVTAAQVRGDGDQLSRALGNVTDNAARHAAGTVSFTLAERDGAAVLAVSDDGPGIPAQHHERIFERFTRLDDARSVATGGAGLGLAIAREIVERHHGSIAVDPDHHPGARFVITLPLNGP